MTARESKYLLFCIIFMKKESLSFFSLAYQFSQGSVMCSRILPSSFFRGSLARPVSKRTQYCSFYSWNCEIASVITAAHLNTIVIHINKQEKPHTSSILYLHIYNHTTIPRLLKILYLAVACVSSYSEWV